MPIYFVSDLHLGYDEEGKSSQHEHKIVSWLQSIASVPSVLYFVGDTFDYWFEYGDTLPNHSKHFLKQIDKMVSNGWQITLLTGNHDLWLKDALPTRYGVKILDEPTVVQYYSKTIYLHHGDGIGKGDRRYKLVKSLFSNSFLQWLFGRLPAEWGYSIMKKSSAQSRKNHKAADRSLFEKHYAHCKKPEFEHVDYFIMGHLHTAAIHRLNERQTYYNLGEWFGNRAHYARLDDEGMRMHSFEFDENL